MKTIPVLSPFRLSTLTPWLSGFLPLPFRRRKRGTGFDNPAPRFRPLHFNGKTVCTTAAADGRFCGGSAPAPPASPKEQDKGKCVTGGRGHLLATGGGSRVLKSPRCCQHLSRPHRRLFISSHFKKLAFTLRADRWNNQRTKF